MPATAAIERFAAMGTRVEIHVFDLGSAGPTVLAEARCAIEAVDDALTIHRPSPTTALNDDLLAGRVAAIRDELLFTALIAADTAHTATFGLFDVAADRANGATWDAVRFDRAERTIAAERPLGLDFGGIGKGMALDRAAAVLRAGGVRSALLSAGESSIAVVGAHPLGGGWPFAVPHPLHDGGELVTVELAAGQALSISATIGGGAAAPGRAALVQPAGTIVTTPRCAVAIADTATAAEALSTALIVADTLRAEQLLSGDRTRRFRFDLDAVTADQTLEMVA